MIKIKLSYRRVFLFATLVALFTRLVLWEGFRITSGSMFPTLHTGDLVFVSKSAFNIHVPFSNFTLVTLRAPEKGEVVIFSLPDHSLETMVKRVIATEGDRVAFQDGVLYVNDIAAEYQPLQTRPLYFEKFPWTSYPVQRTEDTMKDFGPVEVPKGHFFVLGDNRAESVDSRAWGPIPTSCLKGRVALVWLSLSSTGKILSDRVGLWVQ